MIEKIENISHRLEYISKRHKVEGASRLIVVNDAFTI